MQPSQPVVPARLRERILRGEFIELSDLLPDAIATASDPAEVLQLESVGGGRKVQLVQKSLSASPQSKRHVHDIGTWLEAFTVYCRVIVDSAPDRAAELLAYQAIILDANCRFHTDAWLAYDRMFRTALSAMPHLYAWHRIDTNMWQTYLTGRGRMQCSRCSLVHPPAASCPFRGGPSTGSGFGGQYQHSSSDARFNGKTICRNYNLGRCSNSPCSRAHVCLQCRGKHPAQHCTTSKSSTSSHSN